MLLGLVKDPFPAAPLSVSCSVSLIFLADAAGPALQGLPHLGPFLLPCQVSGSPSLLLLTSLQHQQPISSTIQTCLCCKKSWMGSVVNSTNNIAGHGYVQHLELTLFGSFPISMVVRPCYENQLNSGGRLWSCESSSGPGTGFLHSFRWIC